MRKDKTKRIKINKILTISMSLVLFMTVILTIVAINYKSSDSNVDSFNATTESYNSNQAYITTTNVTTSSNLISMTEAYASPSTSYSDYTITIANDDELYLFSTACNEYSAFLGYKYKLLSNITYSISSQFIPIGWDGTPFSGVFDGCGFEISNFKMLDITAQIGNASTYSAMTYYAMFADNTGTIQNLGLIESRNQVLSVEIDNIIDNGGVANLVGHNQGTVTKCYYKDLRDMEDDEIGLAIYGGYRIAGLVYLNDGTFTDSYVAVSTVANHKITGYEGIAGICYEDNKYDSSTSNLYYYDGSIYSYKTLDSGGVEITYTDEVFADNTFLYTDLNVGVYCSSTETLNGYYNSTDDSWFLPSVDYPSALATYIKNETPILRGLTFSDVDSNNKYTATVASTNDFLYMFELMNGSDFFAEDTIIYSITNDIDLEGIEASHFAYNQIITSTITGVSGTSAIAPKLITNESSTYPTIYNFDAVASARKTATLGIDAYGLFPYVGGTISYLNIIPDAISLDTIEVTDNVKGVAAVSGFVEKGTISNVNVYITTTHTSTDIKEFYLGGIAGVLGGEGKIDNCTVSGTYKMSKFTAEQPIASVYTRGDAIGGVVGYIDSTYGNIDTCLSAVDMTLNFSGSSIDYQIGGVVGAAYTMTATGLENLGTISVGTSTAPAVYNSLYVSGVIGRHLGVKSQVTDFTNQGTITVYGSDTTKSIYVSGIENADIKTDPVSNTGIIASTDKTKDGKYRFMASSLTNRANIYTLNSEIADKVEYTSGINVLTANGFVTELSGVYNLNYTEKYNSSTTKKKTSLGAFKIDMYTAHKYSGVVNVINAATPDASMTTTLSTVYNLRNLEVAPSSSISGSYNYEYYGTVSGQYINYNDVRNEGSITSAISKNLGAVGTDTVNIILVGVLEEVSIGCYANNIYNGGDINLTFSTSIVSGNVITSGICYKNTGYDASTINQFNPFSTEYDSAAEGSLNNVINNGDITVDNPTYFSDNNIKTSYTTVLSANGQSNLGSVPDNTASSYYVTGDVFVSGVAAYNYAPITNTFNLGDLFAANYIVATAAEAEINVAGLINLNIGQYAYVLNSANNGTLSGINLSSGSTYLSNVNVAGIIARNDELEDGSAYSSDTTNPNSSQIVSFTINYGNLYSYNYAYNITSTSVEPKAKSAGILAMGLCNAINVLNYGNVYGSETASGIYGVLYFNKYTSEVTSDNLVYIANTINYGNVYMLSRGYNNVHGLSYYDYSVISYDRFKEIFESNEIVTSSSTAGNVEAFTSVARNTSYISVIGSVFSIINFASKSNANNINIRYLISFNESASIVGATANIPSSVTADTSSFYSAYITTNSSTGAKVRDTWMGKYVQYSPLITSTYTDKFVTSISQSGVVSTSTQTFTGVFNTNFAFRQAINKNSTYYNTDSYVSDNFISDYFEFVQYNYINSVLLDKIGWRTIAVSTAANDFAKNLSYVAATLQKLNTVSTTAYDDIVASALSSGEWVKYLSEDSQAELLNSLVTSLTTDQIYNYIQALFTSSSTSTFMTSSVLTDIMEAGEAINPNIDYSTILSNILTYNNNYSSLIADGVLGVNTTTVSSYLNSFLNSSTLTLAQKVTLIKNNISYEQNGYFDYGLNEATRIEILTDLFDAIDEDDYPFFYIYLYDLLGVSSYSTISEEIQLMSGYASLSSAEKIGVFVAMFNYESRDDVITYLTSMSSEIGMYTKLINSGYSVSSMTEITNSTKLTQSSTDSTVINERLTLWNKIRGTKTFKSYLSGVLGATTKKYYLATEFNNTYQSVTEPHNSGAYRGDTAENRLSYLYTTDITPEVYFYGPYRDSSGTAGTSVADANTSLFSVASEDIYKSTDLMLSRGGKNSDTTFIDALGVWDDDSNAYTSKFSYNNANGKYYLLYYDLQNEQLGGAIESYTYNDESYYGMGETQLNATKSLADPMSSSSTAVSTSDWSGVEFGNYDYNIYVEETGETFNLKNGSITGIYHNSGTTITLNDGRSYETSTLRSYICDEDGTYHLLYGDVKVTNNDDATDYFEFYFGSNTSTTYKYYSYLLYKFAKKLYTVNLTKTSTLHSTGYTGIYRYMQNWGSIPYYTWKQTQNKMIATTQYIDYTYLDILNLDGYLTQYADGTTVSDDEVNIINDIFNTYLISNNNFSNAVEEALFEVSMGVNNYLTVTNKLIYDNYSNIYSYDSTNNKILNNNGDTVLSATITYGTSVPTAVTATGYVTEYSSDKSKIYIYLDPDILDELKEFVSINAYTDTLINSNNPLKALDYSSSYTIYSYLIAAYNNSIDKKLTTKNVAVDYSNVYEALIDKIISYDSTTASTDDLSVSLTTTTNAYDSFKVVNLDTNVTYGDNTYNKAIQIDNNNYYTIPVTSGTNVYITAAGVSGSASTYFYIYNGSSYDYLGSYTFTTTPIKLTIDSSYITNDLLLIRVYNSSYSLNIYDVTQPLTHSFTHTVLSDNTDSSLAYRGIKLLSTSELADLIYEDAGDEIDYTLTTFDIDNFIIRKDSGNTRYINILYYDEEITSIDTSVKPDVFWYSNSTYNNTTVTFSRSSTNFGGTYNTSSTFADYLAESGDRYLYVTQSGSKTSYDNTPAGKWGYQTYFKGFTYYIEYTKEDSIINYSLMTNSATDDDKINYIYGALKDSNFDIDSFVNNVIINLIPLSSDNTVENSMLKAILADDIDDFTKHLLVNSDYTAFMKFVNAVDTNSSNAQKFMKAIGLLNYRFIYSYISSMNTAGTLTEVTVDGETIDKKALVAAAYLVSDYTNIYDQSLTSSSVNVSTTLFNTEVLDEFDSAYQYISSTGTFDADKFDAFVDYVLGQAITASGYGIFALASSRGIKNGAFIPDNFDLLSMDANYNTTASDDSSSSIITLTTSANSSWRDETGSTTSGYDTANTDSVNYHVRIEMKQLLKAISNVIFELDLTCNDTTLYSSTDQIDYEDKIITYYVSEDYLLYIRDNSTLTIEGLSYADTAACDKAVGDSITLTKYYTYSEVTLTSSTFDSSKHYTYDDSTMTYSLASEYDTTGATTYYEITQIDSTGAITIIPEEDDYTATYTLRFIKIDTTISSFAFASMKYLSSEDSTEYTTVTYTDDGIPYYGATLTFTVTAANLPDGMDLKSFFTITDETIDSVWGFDLNTANNGIVSSGVANIAVNIDISMSQGNKDFVLNLYGTTSTVTIAKNPNKKSLITSFGYDGTDYTSTMQSAKTAASEILFGRAFNYTDLTSPYILTTDTEVDSTKTYYTQSGSNSSYSYSVVSSPVTSSIGTYYEANSDFYLYSFAISSNATVKISAAKTEDSDTGLMTYTVTYVVTSEYGSTTTYTHTLTEKLYFTDGAQYATLYKAGEATTDIYTTDFQYNEAKVEASGLSSLTYDADAEDNYVAVIFNRGYAPQYRIRYDISNFYGDISLYSVAEGSANTSTTSPQNTYAGITITIDDENEPGVYKYTYTYTNTGNWTTEGGYTKLSSSATYDSTETYYTYSSSTGQYTVRTVSSAAVFSLLKNSLYIYSSGSSEDYTRTYTFPALYIIKDYAVDALFEKLTFLDESVVLGGTASVMLPTTPISAGSSNTDDDAEEYDTVFENYASQKIVIYPNSIDYNNTATDASAVSVTDYYTVGTVSDTDLENYAPSITVEDHAQVFKYTTITKLTKYGADNNQTVKDSSILTTRDDMLLYVPFVTGSGNNAEYIVFMVLLDSNMKWTKVYPNDFNGVDTNDSKVIKNFGAKFTTLEAEKDTSLTKLTYDGNTYVMADYAGNTDISNSDSSNISLYMDYIGDPLDDHFWYISYVVFSEYYLNNGITDKNSDKIDDLGAVRYYHISIVDASNTVYFDVSLYAPDNFKLDDIYITFAENVYDTSNNLTSYQMSCYLEKYYSEVEIDSTTFDSTKHYTYDSTTSSYTLASSYDQTVKYYALMEGASGTDEEGLILYKLKLSMAALPAGYFYFYIDLPNGYGAVCYTNKDNELDASSTPGSDNTDSYLPHTTIIPITIGLKIIVSELTGSSSTVWAVNTSDLYTRQISYKGVKTF